MTTSARWRAWLRAPTPLPPRRGLLVASAVLLVLSLGAPWKRVPAFGGGALYAPMFKVVTPVDPDGTAFTSPGNPTALVPDWTFSMLTVAPRVGSRRVAGTAHPARVPIAVSGVLGFLAVRRRSRRLMAAGLAVAAVGLVLTSAGSLMSPGWVLLAVSTGLAAFAVGLAPSSTPHHLA